jgi:SAM-dependent methyltransferase
MPANPFLFLHLRDLPYFRALLRSVEAQFYQSIELPRPTLDLGCGDGHFASLAFDRRLEVGLDPWPRPLREACRRGAYRWLVQADGAAMPFPAGHFASAVSNSVLEHIPHLDAVLIETARLLRPGAPFVFCVPNPRYFSELSLARLLGRAYVEWFRRISRVHHADEPDAWQARLERAGFRLERWWHYFSPSAMRVLEWGHYLGLPALLARSLTGRWILAPTRWNLGLTQRLLQKYAVAEPLEDGAFTFYIAVKDRR